MKHFITSILFIFISYVSYSQDIITPNIKIDSVVKTNVKVTTFVNNGWYQKVYFTHTYMRYMRNDKYIWVQEYDAYSNLISSEQFTIIYSEYNYPYRITTVKSKTDHIFEIRFNMVKILVYHDYLNGTQDKREGEIYY